MDATTTHTEDLYSLLKVDRDATEEEIHRAYKALSTTFHPDKLPPNTSAEHREHIHQVFLEVKRANDVLIDPVFRLVYDTYGEDGVTLIKRIQQQTSDQQTRKEATADVDEEDSDDEEDDLEATLYERVERLLTNNPLRAKEELQKFMEQHDYHDDLMEKNQVQLACNLDFPTAVNLESVFFEGRDYLQALKQRTIARIRQLPADQRKYHQRRYKEEQNLVDYQINEIRDMQKASVGCTIASAQPHKVTNMSGEKVQPKWSMAMGATTDVVYPEVAKIVKLAGKEVQEQKHPVSTFVNSVYQPVPGTQVNLTANISNNDSHQFILGSARTFTNKTTCRYSLTFLSKSPLSTNMILNLKSFRHIKDTGMVSGGMSMGANGQFLQWNTKWEASKGTDTVHKVSANVSLGRMQGNSLELSYKLRSRKRSWIDEYVTLPHRLELSTVLGRFPKIEGMILQDFTTLAHHPSLGFGMEHDISLGVWTWIWEWSYNGSSFRIPVPVLHLGTIANPGAYYSQRFYYGVYCLLLQASLAGILQDDGEKKVEQEKKEPPEMLAELSSRKARAEAEKQLAMMEAVADRRRDVEVSKNGLVIVKAAYWLEVQENLGPRMVSMDATTQLQFWVTNGRLSLPPVPKSSLLGFYDLETEAQPTTRSFEWDWKIWKRWNRRTSSPEPRRVVPHLTVRYSHQDHVYEITVSESEPLVLPSDKARLIGLASLVH